MTELLGTMMRTQDGAQVSFERRYATDAADLWDAVTSAERLARWFAPVTGDLREGGEFTIHFDDADAPTCRVESCDAPRGFTWSWPLRDRASTVSVSVVPDGDGAVLRLDHAGLAPQSAPEYGAGWQAYVLSLGADLAGEPTGGWWDDFADAKEQYAAALG